jgi:hypothetical protein
MTRCRVVMIEAEELFYEDADGTPASFPIDRVALALGWRPSGHDLGDAIGILGIETVVLGDAAAPADFVNAINAGADAALAL